MTHADRGVRFIAPDGTYWTAHEIADKRAESATHALIFVSDEGFRRVRSYPENWRTLTHAELWELSWRR